MGYDGLFKVVVFFYRPDRNPHSVREQRKTALSYFPYGILMSLLFFSRRPHGCADGFRYGCEGYTVQG